MLHKTAYNERTLFASDSYAAYLYYLQTGVCALLVVGSDTKLVLNLIDFWGYQPSSRLLVIGAYLSCYVRQLNSAL